MPTIQHHLQNAVDTMTSPIADKVTVGVVGAGITLPMWLQKVHEWSPTVADFVPYVTVILIILQIIMYTLKLLGRKIE